MNTVFLRSWIPTLSSVFLILILSIPVTTRMAVIGQYIGLFVITILTVCIIGWSRLPIARILSGIVVTVLVASGGWGWIVISSDASERFFRIVVVVGIFFVLFQWLSIMANAPLRSHRGMGVGRWMNMAALFCLLLWSLAVWSFPTALPMVSIQTILWIFLLMMAGLVSALAGIVGWREPTTIFLLSVMGATISTLLLWLPVADTVRFLLLVVMLVFVFYPARSVQEV